MILKLSHFFKTRLSSNFPPLWFFKVLYTVTKIMFRSDDWWRFLFLSLTHTVAYDFVSPKLESALFHDTKTAFQIGWRDAVLLSLQELVATMPGPFLQMRITLSLKYNITRFGPRAVWSFLLWTVGMQEFLRLNIEKKIKELSQFKNCTDLLEVIVENLCATFSCQSGLF